MPSIIFPPDEGICQDKENALDNTEQDKSECGLSRMLDILYSKFSAATVLSSTEVNNKAPLRGCSVDKPCCGTAYANKERSSSSLSCDGCLCST